MRVDLNTWRNKIYIVSKKVLSKHLESHINVFRQEKNLRPVYLSGI